MNQWQKAICEAHNSLNGKPPCDCKPPFRLFNFPTEKKDPEARLLWCKLINRAPEGTLLKSNIWTPGSKSRVCSSHFINQEPNKEHPYPVLNLGYPNYEKRVENLLGKKRKTRTSVGGLQTSIKQKK